MAKTNEDNYTRPEDKARWGFAGTANKITIGDQTVGETPEQGEVESVASGGKDVQAPRNNGGGTADKSKSTDKAGKAEKADK